MPKYFLAAFGGPSECYTVCNALDHLYFWFDTCWERGEMLDGIIRHSLSLVAKLVCARTASRVVCICPGMDWGVGAGCRQVRGCCDFFS